MAKEKPKAEKKPASKPGTARKPASATSSGSTVIPFTHEDLEGIVHRALAAVVQNPPGQPDTVKRSLLNLANNATVLMQILELRR